MTMQTRDIICVEGEEFRLQAEILEPFFKLHPERKPKSNRIVSSHWRNYIAYIQLHNNELFVNKMIVRKDRIDERGERVTFDEIVDLSKIFLSKEEAKLLFFSGFIMLYYYPSKQYWSAEWKRFPYKFYTIEKPNKFKLLQIERGELIESRIFNVKELTEFKRKQFSKFKEAKSYKKMLNRRLLEYDDLEDSITGFTKEIFDDGVCQNIIKYTKEFL